MQYFEDGKKKSQIDSAKLSFFSILVTLTSSDLSRMESEKFKFVQCDEFRNV